LQRDLGPEGPVRDMGFLEFDVQETRDGEVVVFHDFKLSRAFPCKGVNIGPWKSLQAQGIDPGTATVQDLTLSQLQSLHLGCHSGVQVPTLSAFLSACQQEGLRWPLVVEVKRFITDKGRQGLVDALRQYRPYTDKLEERYRLQQQQQRRLRQSSNTKAGSSSSSRRICQHGQEPEPGQVKQQQQPGEEAAAADAECFRHPVLGFFSVIGFPHHYAASFGEFGSAECVKWSKELDEVVRQVCCCFMYLVSYVPSRGCVGEVIDQAHHEPKTTGLGGLK